MCSRRAVYANYSFICVSYSFVSVAGLLAVRDELKAQTQSYSLSVFVSVSVCWWDFILSAL